MGQIDSTVILLADDGPDFGLGHVRRLEYLQKVLEPAIREKSRLISRENHPPNIANNGSRREFWQEVHEEFSSVKPGLCVFDLSYSNWEPVWGDIVNSLPSSTKSIGIDVPREWMHRFDYVIHPGVGKSAGSEDFPNWQGGPEWVLAHRSPPWSPSSGTPKITVTTGSQAFDFFRPWLEHELASLSEAGIEVSWVVGKHSGNQLDSLNSANNPIAYVDDFQLNERFSRSNLVITRFGVTAFELTARGVPTIILPGWSGGEREEVSELERAGVALVARTNGELAELAYNLANNRSFQTRLSNLGKDYFKLEKSHPLSLLVSQLVEEQN